MSTLTNELGLLKSLNDTIAPTGELTVDQAPIEPVTERVAARI